MFRAPIALLLSLSLLTPFKWFANTFRMGAMPIDVASASVVRITGVKTLNTWMGDVQAEYGCSGFTIAEKRVLTANHCLSDIKMLFDGHVPGKVILKDAYYDLALVQDDASDRKPLELRETEVVRDEQLIAIGYAFGWERLLTLPQMVRIPAYPIEDGAASGLITSGGLIGGMSGGPMIDAAGKVVAINQRGSEFIGYGVGTTIIRAFLYDAEAHDSYGKQLVPRTDFIPKPFSDFMSGFAKAPGVDLKVTPGIVLSVPATLRTTIRTEPDPEARELCLEWDSMDGERGSHCFPHEGEEAPKTTTWDLTIHQPGVYGIRANLIRVSDVIYSIVREVQIAVEG